MNRSAIRLDGVSVCYRLARQRIPSLKEYAIHWMRGALKYEPLWALREVSFEVRPGEAVGVVGRNGAGKSTLLKVISRVLEPTHGRCVTEGSVSPILELGSGFDRELTGFENVFLNALLLGRRRHEIIERLEAIVDFAEVGEFIHSPLRNFSSGMMARLGFAIATAWRPDVLILDEVFAVGDVGFAKKCEGRMAELRASGTTFLLVSHAPEFVARNCTRAIWIDRGEVQMDGGTTEVLAAYSAAALPAAPVPEGSAGAVAPGPFVPA